MEPSTDGEDSSVKDATPGGSDIGLGLASLGCRHQRSEVEEAGSFGYAGMDVEGSAVPEPCLRDALADADAAEACEEASVAAARAALAAVVAPGHEPDAPSVERAIGDAEALATAARCVGARRVGRQMVCDSSGSFQ